MISEKLSFWAKRKECKTLKKTSHKWRTMEKTMAQTRPKTPQALHFNEDDLPKRLSCHSFVALPRNISGKHCACHKQTPQELWTEGKFCACHMKRTSPYQIHCSCHEPPETPSHTEFTIRLSMHCGRLRMVADGCEWLRMVADGCGWLRSPWRNRRTELYPQTPNHKPEPFATHWWKS